MKQVIFILFVLFLIPKNSFGCTCIGPSSFCESITDAAGNLYAEIILRGKIIGSSSEGKLVKVDQSILGDVNQNEIIVRPDFCTLFYQDLEDDAEYIFALYEQNEKFYLIGCAICFLKVENEIVTGKIAPGISQIKYDQLSNLEGCGNAFAQINFKNNLKLFPNPTTDFLRINFINNNNVYENLQVRIFDASGREIGEYTRIDIILPEEDWKINMQDFMSGVYLVHISSRYQEVTHKIFKL